MISVAMNSDTAGSVSRAGRDSGEREAEVKIESVNFCFFSFSLFLMVFLESVKYTRGLIDVFYKMSRKSDIELTFFIKCQGK